MGLTYHRGSARVNDESAINHVPDEILADILFLARGDLHSYPDDQKWLKLHLVCRRWRDILCSTSAFWRDISMNKSVEWVRLCLSRSKDSLLSLRFFHGPSAIPDNAIASPMLADITRRVRSLSFLGIERHTVDPTLAQFLVDTTGMPLLVELILHALISDSDSAPFPERAQNLVRQLRLLDLHVYEVPKTIVQCQYLRILRLINTPFPHIALEDLLTMLSRNTLLEELAIQAYPSFTQHSHLHAGFSPPDRRSHQLVSFTKLHKLRLISVQILVQNILGRFCFPKAVDVEVNSASYGVALAMDHGILAQCLLLRAQSCAEILPVLSSATALEVTVDDSPRSFHVEVKIPGTDKPVELAVGYAHAQSFSLLPPSLRDIVQTFSPAPIAEVIMDAGKVPLTDFRATVETWASFFRALPLLTKLELVGWYTASWTMWNGLLLACSAQIDDTPCCPCLRILSVVEEYPADFFTSPGGPRIEDAWKPLIDALEYREKRGQRLQALNLMRYDRSARFLGPDSGAPEGPCTPARSTFLRDGLVDSFAYNVGPDMPELKVSIIPPSTTHPELIIGLWPTQYQLWD